MRHQLARRPTDEPERLRALHDLELLDSPAEPEFERITRLAARLFRAPVALISLLDSERVWFKSRVGLDASEVPRDLAFCAHAVLSERPTVIPDTRLDPRFAGNPLVVDGPQFRFYAGAPLTTPDGHRLGTACVLDSQPRPPLTPDEEDTLVDLAALAVDAMLSRRERVELARHTTSFRSLVEALPLGVLISLDGQVRYANPSSAFLLGADSPQQLEGRSVLERVAPEFHEVMRARMESVAREMAPRGERDVRLLTLDGQARTVELTDVPVFHEGEPATATLFRDVTEHRRHEELAHAAAEALANERLLLDSTLASVADGVALLSPDRRILLHNRAYAEMFGSAGENLVGLHRDAFAARCGALAEDPGAFLTKFMQVTEDNLQTPELFVLARPRRRVLERVLKPAEIAGGQGWVVVWHDVTADHELAAERERRATTDPLTGLLNRRGIEDILVRERARARREKSTLAAALLDIDHFKDVNDRLGHAAGDAVLVRVAQALRKEGRSTDLVARWGGEEFVVVLDGPTAAAQAVAERMRRAVEQIDSEAGRITLSAGVTSFADVDEPLEAVLARADVSLYEAKRQGRNRVIRYTKA